MSFSWLAVSFTEMGLEVETTLSVQVISACSHQHMGLQRCCNYSMKGEVSPACSNACSIDNNTVPEPNGLTSPQRLQYPLPIPMQTPTQCMPFIESPSDVVITILDSHHLIRPCAVFASTPASSPALTHTLLGCIGLWPSSALGPKINGSQFAPLTCPHTQRGHERCAACLKCPPEEVRRDRMRVERCNNQVNEVDRERKVKDKFGASDEEKYEHRTGAVVSETGPKGHG